MWNMVTVGEVLDELDRGSAEILLALDRHGRLPTTELRERTGLSNNQVRYRREKMLDVGLIDVSTGESDSERTPPKVHALTARGEALIENGFLDEFPSVAEPGDFDDLRSTTVALRDEVWTLRSRVEDLEGELDDHRDNMERRIGGVTAIDEKLEAIMNRLDQIEERQDELEKKRGFL